MKRVILNSKVLFTTLVVASITLNSCSTLREIQEDMERTSTTTVNTPMMSNKQIREDIDDYLTKLHSMSPFIYGKVDSLSVVEFADFIRAKDNISYNEFFLDFQKLIGMFEMSHTGASWPLNEIINDLNNSGTGLFPIAMKFDELSNKWNMVTSDDELIEIHEGDVLKRINGMSSDSLINTLFDYQSGPRKSRYYFFENGGFSLLMYMAGHRAPFDILIERNGQEINYISQGFNPFIGSQNNSNVNEKKPKKISDYIDYEILDNGVGIIRLKSFFIIDKMLKKEYYYTLERAISEFNSANVKTVLLDLRNNGGGTSEIASKTIKYFIKEPYKIEAKVFMKVSPEFKANVKRYPALIRFAFNTFFYPGYLSMPDGITVVRSLSKDKIKPVAASKRFNGNVYMAINQTTSSAALYLADAFSTCKLGILIGEPTMDIPTEHSNALYFKAKNSGISYMLPSVYGIRANGDPNDFSPVTPEIVIPYTVEHLKKGEDPILDYMRKLNSIE